MKIPKYIEDDLKSALSHFQKGNALINGIQDYIENHYEGEKEEPWRDGKGKSLIELENGSNVVEAFLERMKKDFN